MDNLELSWVMNRMPKSDDKCLEIMSIENVEKARRFHKSFPQYSVTAMANLKKMAQYLGLGGIYVKDERFRFGLNAFKVLGASFAMGRYIAHEMGEHVSDITYDDLTSPELEEHFGRATFFTATDGNHGRGVAWAARRLHQKAVVHMPKGSAKSRFDNIAKEKATVTIEDLNYDIAKEKATVTIEDLNYDDCVRLAAKEAAETEHGVVIQDTAWDGYEDIPSWIMQGYGTISHEAAEQLRELEVNRPTHVFIQAGVGSFASSVVGYFTNLFPDHPPKFIIVEPKTAACLYKGAKLGTGEPQTVTGDLKTIMAGLACGEPNILGWDILRNHATAFIEAEDWVAAKGMRMLAVPVLGDPSVISGESGAVTMGVLGQIMMNEELWEIKELLGLNKESKVLLFSTEGNTDPEYFLRVVWDGAYGIGT